MAKDINHKVNADQDYPLGTKRPELVKTPTDKSLEEITLDKVLAGDVKDEDLRITENTLDYQAEIAEQKGRKQFGKNLKKAGELTKIPDDRILEIYNSLRPNRSTKKELLAIAAELENEYQAEINAKWLHCEKSKSQLFQIIITFMTASIRPIFSKIDFSQYNHAKLIREAAEVYEKRNKLKSQ